MPEEVKSDEVTSTAEVKKPFYLSKTIWVQVLGLIAVIVGAKSPGVSEFIKTYFAEVGSGWVILNIVLRTISKDKISIS